VYSFLLLSSTVVVCIALLPPTLQVLLATHQEYVKVSDQASNLADLGVAGMGVDPFEDCPACSADSVVERPQLREGELHA
jgi:hypothetical protein